MGGMLRVVKQDLRNGRGSQGRGSDMILMGTGPSPYRSGSVQSIHHPDEGHSTHVEG